MTISLNPIGVRQWIVNFHNYRSWKVEFMVFNFAELLQIKLFQVDLLKIRFNKYVLKIEMQLLIYRFP